MSRIDIGRTRLPTCVTRIRSLLRFICSPADVEYACLLDLDELDRFAARSFDHDRAGVAERVGRRKERNPFRPQLGDPGIEVGDPERDVVVELSARADERLLVLAHVPGEHYVAEGDGGGRHAE